MDPQGTQGVAPGSDIAPRWGKSVRSEGHGGTAPNHFGNGRRDSALSRLEIVLDTTAQGNALGFPRARITNPVLRSALIALCLLLAPLSASAQGTKADYERAADLEKRFANQVFKASVKPQWFANDTRFWYRNDLAGDAREFILVDALAGTRQPAFDHARVAEALTEVAGEPVRATHLPVDRLEFGEDRHSVTLHGKRQRWRLDLDTYQLEQAGAAEAASETTVRTLNEPQASTRTGEETSITFVNRTEGNVELYWMNTGGERVHYATLKPGAQHAQHTFDGHVWLATDTAGKTLNVFEATDTEGTAFIDGKPPAAPPRSEGRRGRRPRGSGASDSPDGKLQAFFRDHNLCIRNLEDEEEYTLSTEGSEDDAYSGRIWWSPDSQRVVALRTKQGSDRKVYYVESSPKDQLQPKLHSYDYRKPGDDIPLSKPQLFDPHKRKHLALSDELFPNPWAISEVRWEPDSSAFTFLYNQRGHQVMRVISVDANTGQARAVVDEQPETFFCYSSKTFLHHLPATQELIWMSERDGWNQLYLYDTETGAVKNQITRGEWVVREVERVDEQNRQVWFKAGGIVPGQDPYHVHYARVNFDGTGLVMLTEGDGTHTVEFSPDQRFFVDKWSRVDLPPVHELRRSSDGRLICPLEQADHSELINAGWRAPERFVARGRDGETDIFGIIIRPTNFDPDKTYPVIEDIYAGPHSAFVPKSFSSFLRMQKLAELGFIMVKLDGMGTSHRSKKFHDVAWKNLGDSGFPDRIAWIKAAAAKYPQIDLTRVGIYGGSAGGQSSTRGILMYPDFYKVAVSDCGCHDNRVDKIWWNEQWMGWPIGPHYEEQSNVTQAHRLQGRLLLIVGEMDENVDPASTLQVVNALVKADKDFEMLVIPGTGHGAAETKYGQRRRADFFVRNLLGVEPRSD
jgi:dipeptidyl aminopeptidase/acylaminoacyl peptidase